MNWTPPKSLVDHALSHADNGLKVFPIVTGGKRPIHKGWIDEATTDPETILKWWRDNPNANIGVATGSVNDIVVIDLDGPEAIEWWQRQNIPTGTVITTASGGKHIYFRTEPDVDIQTNQSKLFRGVDVRAEGGLVVAPGSRTIKGEYRGMLEHIPDAPPELLDILPRRQHFTSDPTQFEGLEPVTAATPTEERILRWSERELDSLERPWREGASWRSTVFQVSCWLHRMVRSPLYAITRDQAYQLVLDHAPFDENWGIQEITAEFDDAERRTDGQFADAPEETRPPLLDGFTILEAQSRLPSVLHDGRDFLTEGIAGLPANDTPGALWAHRSRVIKALIGAGFTEQETATLVWMSPAARTLNEDLDGIRKLWAEVDEAKAEAYAAEASSSGKDVAPAPASERPDRTGERSKVELLSLQERAFVEGEEWWGSRFMDYYREVLPIMSEPYFRLNRWFILSGIFGNRGVIPRDGESDLILNVYGIMIGPSGSGKSESMTPVYEVFRNFFQGGDGDPDIGGNATAAGLVEALIQRDGKTSWFHADEADATLMNWSNDRGEFRGMKQGITDVYGGRVPAIQRSTKRDISGIHAKAYLSTHLTGIPERVASVVDGPDWETGFINRFVWAEGKRLPRSRQSKRLNIRRNTNGAAPKPRMTAFWAAEFQQAASRLERPDGKPVEMDVEHVVDDRYVDLVETLEKVASESRYPSRLEPTFTRLQLTVMKCAGLIALSEGRKVVTMRDFLIAAHQAEEWATNAVVMVERTDESLRTREVNAIEATIADRDGVMAVAEIHRLPQFRNRRRDVEDLIGELVAQGRVERARRKDTNEEIVVLKEGGA